MFRTSFNSVEQTRMSPVGWWAAGEVGIRQLDTMNDVRQINQFLQNNEDPYSRQIRLANEQNAALQNRLANLAAENTAALEEQAAENQRYIQGILADNRKAIETLTIDFTSTIDAQASQLQNVTAAYEEQTRIAENLSRAQTPGANPSADVPLAGDNRGTTRKKEDNSLSSLAILSGLGSASNPMSGLQIA